ncbi:MAG: DUF4114 domain-containing protein [Methylococcaceae bacterium]|nr:DUF4114 domain-containing protein [Methylococcaceae bacterium]
MKTVTQYRVQPKTIALAVSAALANNRKQVPALLMGLALIMDVNSAYAKKTVVKATPTPVPVAASCSGWTYLNGCAGYNHTSGAPTIMTNMSAAIPSNLLTLINSRLPEGTGIGNNPAALAMLTDDAGANLFLKASANVKISYLTEGAGYENSVGFFKFNKAELATVAKTAIADKIIFPNFSSGVLSLGQAVDLGNFVAGDAIGFTIVGNGWQKVVGGAGTHTGQVDLKDAGKIFRTIKRFNPEPTNNNNMEAHTILFAYPEQQIMVLAFEDLNRQNKTNNDFSYTSDNDFNDVIIAIHVDPWSAVDCANCDLLVPTPTPAPAPGATPTPVATLVPTPTATPVPLKGESGPISWREVTTPTEVTGTTTNGGGATVP